MATAKQLAALKKARAARAKNLKAKSKPVKRKAKSRKSPVRKKAPVRRKKTVRSNPINYAVKITAKNGQVGYLKNWGTKGPVLDTLASNALKLNSAGATQLKNAIAQNFAKAVKSVSVVSVHGKKK